MYIVEKNFGSKQESKQKTYEQSLAHCVATRPFIRTVFRRRGLLSGCSFFQKIFATQIFFSGTLFYRIVCSTYSISVAHYTSKWKFVGSAESFCPQKITLQTSYYTLCPTPLNQNESMLWNRKRASRLRCDLIREPLNFCKSVCISSVKVFIRFVIRLLHALWSAEWT